VWAWSPKPARTHWRWQLIRLQDGRAEGDDGVAKRLTSDIHGELHAGLLGLADLRMRVERAGRPLDAYTVELRCSPATAVALAAPLEPADLASAWAAATKPWQAVTVVPTPR
jgi:hypothetical protein